MEYIDTISVVLLTCFTALYVYYIRKQITEFSKPCIVYAWTNDNTIAIVNAGNGPAYNISISSPYHKRKKIIFPLYNGEFGTIVMLPSGQSLFDCLLNNKEKIKIKYEDINRQKYKIEIDHESFEEISREGISENIPSSKFKVSLSL